MDDRKLKVREIAKMVNISTGSASTILNEKLGNKKVFSKWVLRLLTMTQKQQRVDGSESCLSLFTRNKQDFMLSVCDNGRNMDPSSHSGAGAAVS